MPEIPATGRSLELASQSNQLVPSSFFERSFLKKNKVQFWSRAGFLHIVIQL